MNIIAGIKAAATAFVSGPKAESFRALGKQIECLHCKNTLFLKKKISLNTAASSLVGTEWLDQEVSVLVCAIETYRMK